MDNVDEPLHVHNLPQLWQKPAAITLLDALELLALDPASFEVADHSKESTRKTVDSDGVPRYLTSIIASSLSWITDEVAQEQIWNTASLRLSERSGRNAMPSMTRSFNVNKQLTITLHEPSLTEDNLGLKTWTSSLLLSRRLLDIRRYIPGECSRVLELGAGTGLVGISAACLWHSDVTLTDLPEIVPNLKQNLDINAELIQSHQGATVQAKALDWSDSSMKPDRNKDRYQVILAADPIYSSEHPRMLVDTVSRWLDQENDGSRFIVELPLRDYYQKEREELKVLLRKTPLELLVEGEETGFDDWQANDGSQVEVECWWSVWKPASR